MDEDWISRHRRRWQDKAALRNYYRRRIFAPLAAAIAGRAPVLELGAGPGFLSAYLSEHARDFTAVDIDPAAGVSTCDVHELPFPNGRFGAVVGVDCLHHFARPGVALAEISRVLAPGGRLALCEPWTGALGRLFYRHLHHEDCFVPDDPFGAAFGADKPAMDGNACLPKLVLHDDPAALGRACPDLRLMEARPFGCLGYLFTGGFQAWGFPAPVVAAAAAVEAALPRALMRHAALRALFVLERR